MLVGQDSIKASAATPNPAVRFSLNDVTGYPAPSPTFELEKIQYSSSILAISLT